MLSYAESDENYEKYILHVTFTLLPQTLAGRLCFKNVIHTHFI